MEGEPELFRGGDIAFSTARRVMEMLGWKMFLCWKSDSRTRCILFV